MGGAGGKGRVIRGIEDGVDDVATQSPTASSKPWITPAPQPYPHSIPATVLK